jgi:hypothetical protein
MEYFELRTPRASSTNHPPLYQLNYQRIHELRALKRAGTGKALSLPICLKAGHEWVRVPLTSPPGRTEITSRD